MAKKKRPKREKASVKKSVFTGRFEKFKALFLKGGIASHAMIAAGYSPKTAASRSHEYAARVRVKLEQAARAQGLDEIQIIKKYRELLYSKTPKWNAETKGWDEFEAGNIQLEAARDLAQILEPKIIKVGAVGKDGEPLGPLSVTLNFLPPDDGQRSDD